LGFVYVKQGTQAVPQQRNGSQVTQNDTWQNKHDCLGDDHGHVAIFSQPHQPHDSVFKLLLLDRVHQEAEDQKYRDDYEQYHNDVEHQAQDLKSFVVVRQVVE